MCRIKASNFVACVLGKKNFVWFANEMIKLGILIDTPTENVPYNVFHFGNYWKFS